MVAYVMFRPVVIFTGEVNSPKFEEVRKEEPNINKKATGYFSKKIKGIKNVKGKVGYIIKNM